MKTIQLTDVGALKNELNKYRKGKKLEIPRFNQLARLAYLGRLVMTPFDLEDPSVESYLVHVMPPEGMAAHFIDLDEDLQDAILILDAEQAKAIIEILRQGVQDRAHWYQELNQRDFYFNAFYKPKPEGAESGQEG